MIKTYVGPMFSGKSDELIGIYTRMWNKDLMMAFKPFKDDRDYGVIASRNRDEQIRSVCIKDLSEIVPYVLNNNIHTVFIDEVQFLSGDVRVLLEMSIFNGVDFYITGLNQTAEQKPFGIIGDILAISNEIVIKQGFCQYCNKPSDYTFSLAPKDEDVRVGDSDYVPLCENCLRRELESRGKRLVYKPRN